jgi:CheY-like chemotaxis protein
MSSFERCVVLVADDEPIVLQTTTFALKRHGYEVIPTPDGPSALDVCQERKGPIHLALLDVMMPGMTGPELFECLRKQHPKIEVLFMSGYQAGHLLEIAPGIGDVHFIAKPFLPRELVQRVNGILGNEEVCTLLDDAGQTIHA